MVLEIVPAAIALGAREFLVQELRSSLKSEAEFRCICSDVKIEDDAEPWNKGSAGSMQKSEAKSQPSGILEIEMERGTKSQREYREGKKYS